MKRLWLLVLCGALTAVAVAAPFRRPVKPRPVEPWAVPADPVPVPAPMLEKLEVDGLRVRARLESSIPRIEASLVIHTLSEVSSPTAVALLTTAMLRIGGTTEHAGAAFTQYLGRSGLELEAAADPDYLTITVRGPADQAPAALKLLAGLALSPAYPEAELENARDALRGLAELRGRDPLAAATDRLHARLFGEHPYAARIEPRLEGMTRDSLLEAHGRQFVPGRTMLAVSGPIEPRALQAMVVEAFHGWKAGTPAVRAEVTRPAGAGEPEHVAIPGSTAAVAAGRVVPPTTDLDRVATQVLGQVIDAAVRARLHGDGRAGAHFTRHAGAGLLWAWGEGSSLDAVRAVVAGELARAGRGELTDVEIGRARVAALAETLRGLKDMPSIVTAATVEELMGGDPGWPSKQLNLLRTLPPAEVRRVARTLLAAGATVTVSSGPERSAAASGPSAGAAGEGAVAGPSAGAAGEGAAAGPSAGAAGEGAAAGPSAGAAGEGAVAGPSAGAAGEGAAARAGERAGIVGASAGAGGAAKAAATAGMSRGAASKAGAPRARAGATPARASATPGVSSRPAAGGASRQGGRAGYVKGWRRPLPKRSAVSGGAPRVLPRRWPGKPPAKAAPRPSAPARPAAPAHREAPPLPPVAGTPVIEE
jgi:predicted Zn-dependent peptidase